MCYLPVERVHESVKRKRRGNGRRELTGEVGAPRLAYSAAAAAAAAALQASSLADFYGLVESLTVYSRNMCFYLILGFAIYTSVLKI